MTISIVGWAQTPFGKFDNESVESLIGKAVHGALESAGIAAADVDEIFLGHFNAGFSKQDFTAALVLQASDALRFKPATRVENACATGTAAIHQGVRAIESGRARVVLAVGVEQMTLTPRAGGWVQPASCFLLEGRKRDSRRIRRGCSVRLLLTYFERYGDQSDALAQIAAKNHHNGASNPFAHLRKDLGFDFCPSGQREESFRCRSAEAHRLLAGI